MRYIEIIEKFNPNHDRAGRFSSAAGAMLMAFGNSPAGQKTMQNYQNKGMAGESKKDLNQSSKGAAFSPLEQKSLEYGPFDYNKFIRENKEELKAEGKWNPEAAEKLWHETRYANSLTQLKKIDQQEAVDIMREKIPENVTRGWFVEAGSDYKPKIEALVIGNPDLRNAGLNVAHINYCAETKSNISYEDFLTTEFTVYRGGNFKFVDSDVFVSYSFVKSVAEKFGKNIQTMKIRPIDTLGSYQTTGEAEILIPR